MHIYANNTTQHKNLPRHFCLLLESFLVIFLLMARRRTKSSMSAKAPTGGKPWTTPRQRDWLTELRGLHQEARASKKKGAIAAFLRQVLDDFIAEFWKEKAMGPEERQEEVAKLNKVSLCCIDPDTYSDRTHWLEATQGVVRQSQSRLSAMQEESLGPHRTKETSPGRMARLLPSVLRHHSSTTCAKGMGKERSLRFQPPRSTFTVS